MYNETRAAVSGFNRQTGMLTIGRRFQKPFSAPFYEFDATLEFRPGPHGNSGFAIWLHPRYTSVEVLLGAKIQSLGMNLEKRWPSGIPCNAIWT